MAAALNVGLLALDLRGNLLSPWAGTLAEAGPRALAPLFMFAQQASTSFWHVVLVCFFAATAVALCLPTHRTAPLLVAWLFANIMQRAWWTQDGGSNLVSVLLALLVATQALRGPGYRLPWGRWRISAERIFVILTQLQIAALYLTAGLTKVQGELWRRGTAIYYILQNPFFGPHWAAAGALALPTACGAATLLTLAWQLAFATMVWNARLRPWLLLGGFAFHAGIAVTMNLWSFSLSMLLAYSAFVQPRYCAAVGAAAARLTSCTRRSQGHLVAALAPLWEPRR